MRMDPAMGEWNWWALILVYSDAAIIVVRNGCTHPTRVLRRAIAVFVGQSLLILVPSIELRKATCASIHVDRAQRSVRFRRDLALADIRDPVLDSHVRRLSQEGRPLLCDTHPRDVIRWRTVSLPSVSRITSFRQRVRSPFRQVSKWFQAITRDREIWKVLYSNAPVARPPGPFPSQSTTSLERALVDHAVSTSRVAHRDPIRRQAYRIRRLHQPYR
jgi:hypothetical protein